MWTAEATVEHPLGTDRLWFECDHPLTGPPADALLTAMVQPALAARADLAIDAPVSPLVLENLGQLRRIRACWWPQLGIGRLEAPARSSGDEPSPGGSRATFFTGGVDSFHTALDPSVRQDTLITVVGFDVSLGNRALAEDLDRRWSAVASALGRRHVRMRTNLRQITDRYGPWYDMLGPALGAAGLLLRGDVALAHVSAGCTYNDWDANTVHPATVPLHDAPGIRFWFTGGALSRLAKVRAMRRQRLFLEHLQVCIADPDGGNCGRCAKCLRTKLELLAAGCLEHCATLRGPVSPASIRALRLGLSPVEGGYFLEVGQALRSTHPALARQARHIALRAQGRTMSARLRRWLRPFGAGAAPLVETA
ncbi:MAG: hypothetical protein KIT68_11480 [Phycisphaeraceae bacterium]|nr:hypothetical protein [Phycisphaeraceae bacterium]